MEFIEILGIAAGICTSSSLLPQLIKTVKTKEAQDVSLVMFVVLLVGNGLWIYYGVAKSDIPIIATNSLAFVLNIVMLTFKFKYRHN